MAVTLTRAAATAAATALVTVGAVLVAGPQAGATPPLSPAVRATAAFAPAGATPAQPAGAARVGGRAEPTGLAVRPVRAHRAPRATTARPGAVVPRATRKRSHARPTTGRVRLRLALQVPGEVTPGSVVQVRGSLRGSFVVRGKRRAVRVVLQRAAGDAWRTAAATRLRRGGTFALTLGKVETSTLVRVVVRRGGRTVLASHPTRVLPRTVPAPPPVHLFVTRLAAAGGEVVVHTPAHLAQPVPLDVDDDGTPELSGLLSMDGDRVEVEVERLPGVSGLLPVQVEGVFRQDGPLVLPQGSLALGYDARDGDAPASSAVALPLTGLAETPRAVALDVTQDRSTTSGARRFVASLFDGSVGERTAETAVDLRTSTAPGTLAATASLPGDGPQRLELDADATRLRYAGPTDGATVALSVESSDEVAMGLDHLDLQLSGAARDTAVTFVDDVSEGFRLDPEPRVHGLTASGTRGEAVAPALPALPAGATGLTVTGDSFSFVGSGVDLVDADPAGAQLTVAASPDQPLELDAAAAGARMTASTSALPATLQVRRGAPPAETGLSWDAGGTALGGLHLGLSGARDATGVDELRLDLADAPASGSVSLPAGAGGPVAVAADQPVGLLRLSARTGELPLPGLEPGARGYLLRSGADGAAALALTLGQVRELAVDAQAAEFSATTSGHEDLVVDAETATGSFDLTVDDLPATLAVTTTAPSGEDGAGVTWDAASPLGHLGYAAHGVEALDVDELGLVLDDAPATGTVLLPANLGESVQVASEEPVGLLELRARSGEVAWPALAPDEDGVLTSASGAGGVLLARAHDVRLLEVDLADAAVAARTAGGRTFRAVASSGDRALDLRVGSPAGVPAPARLEVGVRARASEAGGGSVVQWESSARADDVDLTVTGIAETGVDELVLSAGAPNLAGLPARFTAELPDELGDGLAVEARNAASVLTSVGVVDLQARRGAIALPDLGLTTRSMARVSRDGDSDAVGLRLVDVKRLQLDAAARAISVEAGSTGAPLVVDVDGAAHSLDVELSSLPTTAALTVDRAPAAQGEGTRLTWSATATISQLLVAATGAGLDPLDAEGDAPLEVDLRGVPVGLSIHLPNRNVTPQPPLAKVTVTGANLSGSGGPRLNELRLASGAGSLPASGGNDKLTFLLGATSNISVKLTNVKGLSFHPINTTIDQEEALNGGTRPIDLNLSLPNESGPAAVVTGQLNKPSFHTELNVAIPPAGSGQPNRLTFVNGTPATPRSMGALTWRATDLGAIKNAAFGFKNVPRILQACLATDGACRPSDRLPAPLANYSGYSGSPAQSATAGGQNRPYPAHTSVDLNDFGTSGSSAAVGSMIEMDAQLDLGTGNPLSITDLYFHRLAFDLGEHPTNQTFGAFTTSIPRLYMFIDSQNKPYVANAFKYPPGLEDLKVGTNASPATADRRLVWLPGGKCGGAVVFGACTGVTVLDNRAGGLHNCGGQRALSVRAAVLGTVNVLNYPLVGQLVPLCS